ncbi:hypothetical protein J6590_000912 [Homalodisca vitripennis]|nr:hypothetical protein J6590_000912 [Homalodisca vitripennis]
MSDMDIYQTWLSPTSVPKNGGRWTLCPYQLEQCNALQDIAARGCYFPGDYLQAPKVTARPLLLGCTALPLQDRINTPNGVQSALL